MWGGFVRFLNAIPQFDSAEDLKQIILYVYQGLELNYDYFFFFFLNQKCIFACGLLRNDDKLKGIIFSFSRNHHVSIRENL